MRRLAHQFISLMAQSPVLERRVKREDTGEDCNGILKKEQHGLRRTAERLAEIAEGSGVEGAVAEVRRTGSEMCRLRHRKVASER